MSESDVPRTPLRQNCSNAMRRTSSWSNSRGLTASFLCRDQVRLGRLMGTEKYLTSRQEYGHDFWTSGQKLRPTVHFVNEVIHLGESRPGAHAATVFGKDFAMPLIRISMRAGKPEGYRQAIFDSLYRAMREALNVPEDDQFMTIREHDAANFRYSASCYGVSRSEDVVYIQITVFDTRTAQQKKALFKRTAELLGKNPGIRPENVFVNVLESAKENWSVGHGLAQFA